jgi:integrase
VKAAALPHVGLTPKALRHTAASMAIAAGADVKVVQRMLGHADATMTLNTYADLWPDRLDDVSNAMALQRSLALGRSDHHDGRR